MAIILEGFDNSGKSTLAASVGLDVVHPGPRPKDFFEERRYLEKQEAEARTPIVMDRVTCVSTPMYSGRPMRHYMPYLESLLQTRHCVMIYCRPKIESILNFEAHAVKGYDTDEKIRWLMKNAGLIVKRYDDLMATVPHLVYDWTNPDREVVQMAYDAQFTIGAWQRCIQMMRK